MQLLDGLWQLGLVIWMHFMGFVFHIFKMLLVIFTKKKEKKKEKNQAVAVLVWSELYMLSVQQEFNIRQSKTRCFLHPSLIFLM